MKIIICFALGYVVFLFLLQMYIVATREPQYVVRCDGGMKG